MYPRETLLEKDTTKTFEKPYGRAMWKKMHNSEKQWKNFSIFFFVAETRRMFVEKERIVLEEN